MVAAGLLVLPSLAGDDVRAKLSSILKVCGSFLLTTRSHLCFWLLCEYERKSIDGYLSVHCAARDKHLKDWFRYLQRPGSIKLQLTTNKLARACAVKASLCTVSRLPVIQLAECV